MKSPEKNRRKEMKNRIYFNYTIILYDKIARLHEAFRAVLDKC